MENQTLLVIGSVWPEPSSSAAGGRMMQLISLFKEQGYSVIFASASQDSSNMVDLESYGVQRRSIELNCSSFDDFVKELDPIVVLFDRFMTEEQFGWRIADNCPNALRVLDTEDLHCLRVARQKAYKEKRNFMVEDLLIEEVANREIASILRCDLSLMISEYEIEILKNVFKIDESLFFYLPFLVDPIYNDIIANLPSFQERRDFVFIGNFLHEPNWNAVQYLKETIWPNIRKQLGDVKLNIYGAYPSQKVLQLHNEKEGFLIHGRAESALIVVQQARVVLAPLRFGAGLKGKLLEAMQCGTPSITTSVGAESMCGDLPWNGFIDDEPKCFSEAAVNLYLNNNTWLQAQKNGFEIVNSRFLKSIFYDDFIKKMQLLFQTMEEHRKSNFMGNLLQFHTMRSTKYMSMWIEEKNKK